MAEKMEPVRKQAEQAAAGVAGVLSVTAVLTAHKQAEHQPQQQPPQQQTKQQPKKLLPQVGVIIAVASGKGGVGRPAVIAGRQDYHPDGGPWRDLHVDRLPGATGHADDMARSDGDGRARTDDG